jgi:hypothetical protein
MSLPSRRPLAEARIALESFDRFLLLYGTMFAAFGVASPFLPALLRERGLGPSEIGAVLAAGTAVRLITGPVISRLADRLGKHRQILAVLLAMAAVIAFGYGLPAGFAIFLLVSVAHASALAPIVPIADAMTLAAAPGRFQYGWVRGGASAAFVVGTVGAGQVVQATNLGGIIWMNGTLLGFCCNDIGSRCAGAVGELRPPGRSCGAIEQVGDDDGLAPDIMTVNLSKLSLPHHRHRFETRQSSPRGMETAEAEPRPDKALDTPVVLLDDVVEVFALPQTGAAR